MEKCGSTPQRRKMSRVCARATWSSSDPRKVFSPVVMRVWDDCGMSKRSPRARKKFWENVERVKNFVRKNQVEFEKFVDAITMKTYSQPNVSYSQSFHIFRTRGEEGGISNAR